MDNLDDSENNAKISDSAYSNSCSNSQSRKSRSSKSCSNSSGSSGYGGNPSTSDHSSSNLGQPPTKRSKDSKKKKQALIEVVVTDAKVEVEPNAVEPSSPEPTREIIVDEAQGVGVIKSSVVETQSPLFTQTQQIPENMDVVAPEKKCNPEEVGSCSKMPLISNGNIFNNPQLFPSTGFSCVISMHDGVVVYTTSTLTTALGFPKNMWIGRSFIDFVHPRDRYIFASQITSGLAVPKNANAMQEKVQLSSSVSTMACRIRRYRCLNSGFAVQERSVVYLPFLLKLSFKDVNDEEGKVIYLVLQATQFHSGFKTSNETILNPVPFVIRHSANGNLEYIDPESVPYLGYLPQDLSDKDVLQLYHPDDLLYLRQVYGTIVKEGGVPWSEQYRMMAHNGDYLKVKTEWSSFINPWSRKLEFVIGKHHVMEGPTNPDVFQSLISEKGFKTNSEENYKANSIRESIVKIMNEVLTKPAEVVKQHMTKRCQDLTTFMESLIEEQPKTDEELRINIQDPDHSYERDSVMLGGISPHHDHNDSKSSSETPLSYNQLNFNENLQRYFNSHQPYSYEDYNTATGENILDFKDPKAVTGSCLSPIGQYSRDSGEMMSSNESCNFIREYSPVSLVDYQSTRLTETLLNKHNIEMEKELVRESRTGTKGERAKTSNETRQKKKEHLARCNSTFQPTAAPATVVAQPHGVKRSSKQMDPEPGTHKHHCSAQRQSYGKHYTSQAPAQHSSTITTTVASSHGPPNTVNMYVLGVGVPQQMSMMSPIPAVPAMFPMYYSPACGPVYNTSSMRNSDLVHRHPHCKTHTAPYMLPGQTVYGSPFVYSPVAKAPHTRQQDDVQAQSLPFPDVANLFSSSTNYLRNQRQAAASNQNPHMKTRQHYGSSFRVKNRVHLQKAKLNHAKGESGDSTSSFNNAINQRSDDESSDDSECESNIRSKLRLRTLYRYSSKSADTVTATTSGDGQNKANRLGNIEDGESSYSSFYSSFFKTDSGSAEEGGMVKKAEDSSDTNANAKNNDFYQPRHLKIVPRRKMEPPWMEQVCATSELIYKYQIVSKNLEEVLLADKQKMNNLEQPSLVNEQLGQLYLDLQLEGVASRLTLEDGITSSSSSGEESNSNPEKSSRRKREYSKLVLIYEEETPLPPPMSGDELTEPFASTSTW